MRFDAIIVGSGPNGLAAAIALAQAGHSVVVYEAEPVPGGGVRSAERTLPGFVNDVCSAVHPLAVSSPFFRTLPLDRYGLEWVHPTLPLAHPFDDGTAAVVERSVDATCERLGEDADAWRRVFEPLARTWEPLVDEVLRPLRLSRHALLLARFGLQAMRTARGFAEARFRSARTQALFAGNAGHTMMPLELAATAAYGLVLAGSAQAVGWPFPRGGAQRLADALVAHLRALGGEVRTAAPVASVEDLPPSRVVLFDVAPRNLLAIAGARFPARYRDRLARFRHAPGAFKMDWALSAPIPWRAPDCARAGTVHLGGPIDEVARALRAAWEGRPPAPPFVLLSQPTLFDPTRAPAGKHVAWAYCHVPNGSEVDMTDAIEAQVERFAPGFRARILARRSSTARQLEQHNPNLVGGDIGGGAQDLAQLIRRPTFRYYATPDPDLFLCSSSTPPGAGVHGMCGFFAAQLARARLRTRGQR